MSSDDAWQVLADCPHCSVEAAIVEWMDPLHPPCLRGVPAERRCRCCGLRERSDAAGALAVVAVPEDLRDRSRAVAALQRWATEEGEPEVDLFCRANLGGSLDDVVALLGSGQVVGTTFDVIAFLFPGSGGGGGGPVGPEREIPRIVDGVAPEERASVVAPSVMDRRTPARVLVSVMVADGSLRTAERTFVARFLEREGLAPMGPDDLRVWRPGELGAPPEPELRDRVLEAAVHLMHLDREREGSEWRVIRTFATAWGVTEDRLRGWDRGYDKKYTTAMTRLGLLVHGLLGR